MGELFELFAVDGVEEEARAEQVAPPVRAAALANESLFGAHDEGGPFEEDAGEGASGGGGDEEEAPLLFFRGVEFEGVVGLGKLFFKGEGLLFGKPLFDEAGNLCWRAVGGKL